LKENNMTRIAENYDPSLHGRAGGIILPGPGGSNTLGKDGDTLLALLHYLTYTTAGRAELDSRGYAVIGDPQPTGPTPGEVTVRAQLTTIFNDRGEKRSVVVEALLDSHVAGARWVAYHKAGKTAERDKQEAIYKQAVSVITWALWEDGIAHEFSMLW
jgi:hypothetical protein